MNKVRGVGSIVMWLLTDWLVLLGSMIVSLILRFEFKLDLVMPYTEGLIVMSVIMFAFYSVFFFSMQCQRILWLYAGVVDVFKMGIAVIATSITMLGVDILLPSILNSEKRFPISIFLIALPLSVIGILGLRLCAHFYSKHTTFDNSSKEPQTVENVMIIGGGSAGVLLIRELEKKNGSSKYKAQCVIDDDPKKLGMSVHGVKVIGDRTKIDESVKKYSIDTIIFAMPTCSAKDKSEILTICSKTGCTVKTIPGIQDLLDGKVSITQMRNVDINDLLQREPIKIDVAKILGYVKNKTVLVTGGGGSIGSELCRQIASHDPKRLIIFDIYENNAYDISNELKAKYPNLDLVTLIGSVRDEKRLDQLFKAYNIDIVYHAAAHKHVPLMEDSPREAIKNNILGTLNTAKTASKYKVKRFILISTDKAVNPTNVMGATKRCCEMIVQYYNSISETDYVAVRFGNVLGSNGSVVPLFKRQIAEGGPVCVTHPDIIRYFMTIPEAVSLVLSAGASAKGGEIFVLDMGKPVRILDLAENMIRLSGFEPYTEIDIKFVGLRPGEKLYEELLMDEEGLTKTDNDLIYIGQPLVLPEDLPEKLDDLIQVAYTDEKDIRLCLKEIVKTYRIPEGIK